MRSFLRKLLGVGAIALGAFIIGISDGVGTSLGLKVALVGAAILSSKKPKAPSLSSTFSADVLLSGDPTAVAPLIYGEKWVGGDIRFRDAAGTDHRDFYMLIVLAGHEIDSVTVVEADRETLTLDGSGNVTAPSKWVGLMNVRFYSGTESQTADATLIAAFPSKWNSNDRLRGRAYAIVKLTFDETNLASPPAFRFKVKGRKIYDPRLDSTNGGSGSHRLATPSTWAWSRNAVLCQNDYDRGIYINGKRVAGRGISSTRFDWANVAAEASVCDQSVSLAAGGTQKRYTCDGEIDPSLSHGENVRMFEAAYAGDSLPSDGKLRYFAGAARTATLSLTDGHFIGPMRHLVHKGESARFDTAQGVYCSMAESGNVVPYSPVVLPSATTGEEKIFGVDLQLVSDVTDTPGTYDGGARAQRVAKIQLQKEIAGKTITCTTSLYGYRAVPGETINVTRSGFGLSSQVMRALEVQLRPVESGGSIGLVVDLTLEAGPSSLYTWAAEETALAAAPALPQAQVPFALPNGAWTPILVNVSRLGSTFTKTGGAAATWDAAFSSQEGFDACYVTWRASQTNLNVGVGLTSDPTANDSYTSVDFWVDLINTGNIAIYENGVSAGSFGSYTTSDQFKILYDGQSVEYYKNETLLRRVACVGARLYADSSFYDIGAAVNSVAVGPLGIQRAVLEEVRDDFAYASTTDFYRRWFLRQGGADVSFATGVAGTPAGTVIVLGNNSGNDETWATMDRLIPYDGVSLYEVGAIVEQPNGSGVFYCGVEGVAADGVTMINQGGSNSYGGQHYFAAAAVAVGPGLHTYRGYFRGYGGSPGAQSNDSSAPGTMYSNAVAYVRPLILANYSGVAGRTNVAAVWVRRLGGALNAKNTVNTPEIDDESATIVQYTTHAGPTTHVGGSGVFEYANNSLVLPYDAAVQITCSFEAKFGTASVYGLIARLVIEDNGSIVLQDNIQCATGVTELQTFVSKLEGLYSAGHTIEAYFRVDSIGVDVTFQNVKLRYEAVLK